MKPQSIAQTWFGNNYTNLSPELQNLHSTGGVLHGKVNIETGSGFAGFLGRRIALKLGVPTTAPQQDFKVTIAHDDKGMSWLRRFGENSTMVSYFQPVGTMVDGFWREKTGALELALAVEVRGGGWYWQLRRAYLMGLRVPLVFLPQTKAFKVIEDGKYRFSVSLTLFPFGLLLKYSGLLSLQNTLFSDKVK